TIDPKVIFCILLGLFSLFSFLLNLGSCSMGWYGSNGSCFKYIAMLSQKANLASVHYLDKHYIINNLIKSYDPAESLTWIGLSDIHKSMWMWSDGSQVEFIHWNGEQPDIDQDTEDCVLINWPGGMQWNDLTCSNLLAFVCEVCPTGMF
uniref:C-type lectin domain-containing protein n=1 Tax=Oncorhynchus tshawytscha TaxID=74940 RepID=A0A8C8LXL6_ONCTS